MILATYLRPAYSTCHRHIFLLHPPPTLMSPNETRHKTEIKPKIIDDILMYSNWFFTFVFVVEMFMKILALGMSGYLDDKWNHLVMVIVILSVIGIILECLEMWTRQGKLRHMEHVTKVMF